MRKGKVNEYALLNGNKETFDRIFSEENPWSLNSGQEQFRYTLVINFIKKYFSRPALKILEIGCAEGNFSEYLDGENFETTAIDISEKAIERAKQKNLKNVNFICSDMVDFVKSEEIGGYDVILIMESFYYMISEKRNIFLKELNKKIKPDAYIILTMPVRKRHFMFLSESRLENVFHYRGFDRDKKFTTMCLSLKGINGKLIEFIPSFTLKNFYLILHKLFFPRRINQKLFVFRKNINKE